MNRPITGKPESPGFEEHRFGFIAVSGRPNVGKSTLVNHLVGRKVSITSRKPQTTRHRILGIRNDEQSQLVLVDVPGLQQQAKGALSRRIQRAALNSYKDVDVILMVAAVPVWTAADQFVLETVERIRLPLVLVINKIDLLAQKEQVLPYIDRVRALAGFQDIVPVSALKRNNLDALVTALKQAVPPGLPGFPAGQTTDRDLGFMAAELIREQVFRQMGREIPYLSAVKLEAMEYDPDKGHRVSATLWVGKDGHKRMLVGKGGARIRQIGTAAREQMQQLWQSKVHLDLWVKVKTGWREDDATLNLLGIRHD